MFVGESQHTLDAKHRVVIPKRFHGVLSGGVSSDPGDGHLSAVLTRGFEGCIFLFSQEGFQRVLERLRTQAFGGNELRKMQRLFFSNTHVCQLDGSGRLLLPEKLRTVAKIGKEVAIVGVADRAEIWDKAAWERFQDGSDDDFDALGEVLCGPDPDGGGNGSGNENNGGAR